MLDALLQKSFFAGGKRVLVNLLRGLLHLLHRVHAGAEVRNFELRQAVLALAQKVARAAGLQVVLGDLEACLLYKSPSPRHTER